MSFEKSRLTNSGRPIKLTPTRYVRFLTYATDDTKAEVIAAGYFNNARADMSVGSIIDAVVAAATSPVFVKMRVTAVPDSGNITVADITGSASG